MIRNNRRSALIVIILLVIGFFIYTHFFGNKDNGPGKIELIQPIRADVLVTIATTGVVEPQNRLEIKPSIGGRIDNVLVSEGDFVKKGEALAWMSSTERAALIDAARSQGEDVLKYWQEAYKQSPIISPIDGEVIVRSVEPGQTVTTADAVLVLSNRLMINAQFDETDIGKVKKGQTALITLDAYPDVKLEGIVDHIAYESEVVSNVTIYAVDILPKKIPEILRSGMSVSVEVIEKMIKNAITVSSDAVNYDNGDTFVFVSNGSGKSQRRDVVVGLNNGESIEIVSGLSLDDKVITGGDALLPKKKSMGNNPFMPSRKKK